MTLSSSTTGTDTSSDEQYGSAPLIDVAHYYNSDSYDSIAYLKHKSCGSNNFTAACEMLANVSRSYKFEYPPSKLMIDKETKNQNLAAQISVKSSNYVVGKWGEGKSCVLVDNTRAVKYATIGLMIEKIRKQHFNAPPFLIVSDFDDFPNWIDQFKFWITNSFYICSSIKDERKKIHDINLLYDRTLDFSLAAILISREQFNRDTGILPRFKWSSIILDEQEDLSIEDLKYYHQLRITQNLRKLCDVNPNVFEINVEDAARDKLYSESFVLCPFSQYQIDLYAQVFQKHSKAIINAKPESISQLCTILTSLYNICQSTSTNFCSKAHILIRIISDSLFENGIVICSCDIVDYLDHIVSAARISHLTIKENESEESFIEKIIKFQESESIKIMIVCQKYTSKVIAASPNVKILIAYDLSWTPNEACVEIIKWQAKIPDSVCYRLLVPESVEEILFSHFWNNIESNPLAFLDPQNAQFGVLMDIFQRMAYALQNLSAIFKPLCNSTLSIFHVSYFDETAFQLQDYNWNPSYWAIPSHPEPKKAKKQSISCSLTRFWMTNELTQFFQLYCCYGYGKWSHYKSVFKRPEEEIILIWNLFTQELLLSTNDLQLPFLQSKIQKKLLYCSKTMNEITSRIQQIIKLQDCKKILEEAENWGVINNLVESASNPYNMQLPKNVLLPEESPEQIKELLFMVYHNGFNSIHEPNQILLSKLMHTMRILDPNIYLSSPYSTNSRNPGTITLTEHEIIVDTLISYGFPDVEQFMKMAQILEKNPTVVQEYVDMVIQYCMSSKDEQKSYQTTLVRSIGKYQSSKVLKRTEMLRLIREASDKVDIYSAEDIEFLFALGAYGYDLAYASPSLTANCKCSTTEFKISQRAKSILKKAPKDMIKEYQDIPSDITNHLPLKLNSQQMLIQLGKITPHFSSKLFIYPLGYKCAVQSFSPTQPRNKIWMEAEIIPNGDNILFCLHPYLQEEPKFVGLTPDEATEKYAKQCNISYIDGHDFFGLNSPLIHKIFAMNEDTKMCPKYSTRFFTSVLTITSEWPQKEAKKKLEYDSTITESSPLCDIPKAHEPKSSEPKSQTHANWTLFDEYLPISKPE